MQRQRSIRLAGCAIAAGAVLSIASGANADVIHVPGEYPTIQAAIDAAAPSGDEIIVAPGAYHEALSFHAGSDVHVHSSGGASVTTIESPFDGTVVSFFTGVGPDTILEGFTITGGVGPFGGGITVFHAEPTIRHCIIIGNRSWDFGGGGVHITGTAVATLDTCTIVGNSGDNHGGGVMINHGAAVLIDCTILQNDSQSGGGLRIEGGSVTAIGCLFAANVGTAGGAVNIGGGGDAVFADCEFIGNAATGAGGAVCEDDGSTLLLTDCMFSGNEAQLGGGVSVRSGASGLITSCVFTDNVGRSRGGGMHVSGSAAVDGCTLARNRSEGRGGGVDVLGGGAVLSNSHFIGNMAWTHGGGLVYDSTFANNCVANCTFVDNLAFLDGGGVYCYDAIPRFMNTVFRGNTSRRGGAMAIVDAWPNVANVTLYGNVAWSEGYGMFMGGTGSANINNSILWDGAPAGQEIVAGGGTPFIDFSNIHGGWTGSGTGNIAVDPLFMDAAAGDLRLQTCSPSVDAGSNAAVLSDLADLDGDGDTAEPCPYDMLMQDRVRGAVDMGAYELQPCLGDVTLDGRVDVNDLVTVVTDWGLGPGALGDVDCDGTVDVNDLNDVIIAWGDCP